jgi:hypothetical protein
MTTESELMETALLIEEMGSTKEPFDLFDVVLESDKLSGKWICSVRAIGGKLFVGEGATLRGAVLNCYYGYKISPERYGP